MTPSRCNSSLALNVINAAALCTALELYADIHHVYVSLYICTYVFKCINIHICVYVCVLKDF